MKKKRRARVTLLETVAAAERVFNEKVSFVWRKR